MLLSGIGCATSALPTKAPAIVGCNVIVACSGCTVHVPTSLINHAEIFSVVSAMEMILCETVLCEFVTLTTVSMSNTQ